MVMQFITHTKKKKKKKKKKIGKKKHSRYLQFTSSIWFIIHLQVRFEAYWIIAQQNIQKCEINRSRVRSHY